MQEDGWKILEKIDGLKFSFWGKLLYVFMSSISLTTKKKNDFAWWENSSSYIALQKIYNNFPQSIMNAF